MSIEKLNHYSLESIPSVYDEEAMTALEMCGRLGKKVNEVISAVNGWQVPQIVNVSPTGDKSGELDRAVIQGKLDAGYAVHLSAGEYYLNGPLVFRPGYMLRGDSQLNTVLNCKAGFIDHENIVSVDHVEVRDVRVKGPGEGIGIDISRKVTGVETGGRYGHFMNVYITGYQTGVLMGGCWCTNFTHCRIEATEICVEQRGGCNHIKYDHCMFLGPVDEKTSTAIKITAEDGAENYGISVDHCDFERHKYAIHAYYCVALTVNSIYAEGIDTVFQLDSCPSFLCTGGYISYPRIVLQGGRTNELPLYSKSGGTIRDIFVRVNSVDKWPLMSTPDVYPVVTENITVQNDGGGTCYANAQLYTSIYNGVAKMTHHSIAEEFNDASSAKWLVRDIPVCGTDVKLLSLRFKPKSDFTLTETKEIFVRRYSMDIGLTIKLFPGTYHAWTEYASAPSAAVGTDYEKLLWQAEHGELLEVSIPELPCDGLLYSVEYASGDMIL